MKNQFIGKNQIFTREELREIRGGNEAWDTYYEGFECGPNGRTCVTNVDCQDLGCSVCSPHWNGGIYPPGHPEEGWPIRVLKCT